MPDFMTLLPKPPRLHSAFAHSLSELTFPNVRGLMTFHNQDILDPRTDLGSLRKSPLG